MLTDELGTAAHIKDRTNRLSVIEAITSTQQKLKLYSKVPENGLALFCGKIAIDNNKTKRVTIVFEPIKPISRSIYHCDSRFHTDLLMDLLQDEQTFGFIVMDGNGCLFAKLQGATKHVLHKFSVDLPKKHGRGGQSALRFARLRLEKRQNYVRKVAELCTQYFIAENKCNVTGLVLAGSAEFKEVLCQSHLFDSRLRAKVLRTVDISYGMESGLNQAVELAGECLTNVKLVQEKKLLQQYFEDVSLDAGRVCYMVRDTLHALEMGAVETLLVWEYLDVTRYVLRNPTSGRETVVHLTARQLREGGNEKRASTNGVTKQGSNDAHMYAGNGNFRDPATGAALEVVDQQPLSEWLAEHYKKFGAKLEFVSDRSQEGSQFCKGFGGIGGLLRWPVDFSDLEGNGGSGYGANAADNKFEVHDHSGKKNGADSGSDEGGEDYYSYEEDFI